MGPLPHPGFHSSGTGFFSSAEREASGAAVPTQRASFAARAASAEGVLGAMRRALGEAGFEEQVHRPSEMLVGAVRGSVTLTGAVRESPGARKGGDGQEFIVVFELGNDLKGNLAACNAFTGAAQEVEKLMRKLL